MALQPALYFRTTRSDHVVPAQMTANIIMLTEDTTDDDL